MEALFNNNDPVMQWLIFEDAERMIFKIPFGVSFKWPDKETIDSMFEEMEYVIKRNGDGVAYQREIVCYKKGRKQLSA